MAEAISSFEQLSKIAAEAPEEKPAQKECLSEEKNIKSFDFVKWHEKHMSDNPIKTIKEQPDRTIYLLDKCPFDETHTGHKEACVIQYKTGMLAFKCHHNSCKNRKWKELRILKEPEAYKFKGFSQKEKRDKNQPVELPPIPTENIPDEEMPLETLLATYKKRLYIQEDYNLTAPLCAFIGNFLPDEPDIMGLVQPSGSLKTEILRAFGETENQYAYPVSSITDHTLVSGHEDNIDTVALLRNRILVIKDLTTLLAKKEDIRSAVFADFRELTDGYIKKEFGNGIKKEYKGIHSSILFGCTNAIERYYSMYSNLGARMMFIRAKNDPKEARKKAGENRGRTKEMREELHKAMMIFVKKSLENIEKEGLPEIPEDISEYLGNLCDFLAIIRTQIHHDFKGEIDEVPEPEFPTRIFNTTCKMMQVYASINGRKKIIEEDKLFAMRFIADNIPTMRMRVLNHLKKNEKRSTSLIAEKSKLSTAAVRRALTEMTALGIVQRTARESKRKAQTIQEYSDTEKEGVIGATDGRSDSYSLVKKWFPAIKQLRGVIRSGLVFNSNKEEVKKDENKEKSIEEGSNNALSPKDTFQSSQPENRRERIEALLSWLGSEEKPKLEAEEKFGADVVSHCFHEGITFEPHPGQIKAI